MTLRPASARWFELLTDREVLGRVLGVLGQTGTVQLEAYSGVDATTALPDYALALERYGQLARRYAAYWPEVRVDAEAAATRSADRAQEDLARLEAWAAEAEPLIARLQSLEAARAGVEELAALLEDCASELPDLGLLSGCGPMLEARIYALEDDDAPLVLPPGVLHLVLRRDGARYLLALGAADELADLDARLAAARARHIELPRGLPSEPAAAVAALRQRSAELAARIAGQRQALEALARRHALPALLAGFTFLDWLVSHVPQMPATQHFAWVTGWTSDLTGRRIEQALERAKLPALLHFPEPPRSFDAPVVMKNPAWARPFELFVRLLGTPGAKEADPSPLVAVIAPLLFGFMFGDVGQGAVLLAAGLMLRRRWPALWLLVPGGLSAIAFGFAFGSVFAREDLIPALWLHPIAEPLTVLVASLMIGVAVILLGLVIDGVEHAWRGAAAGWWSSRAGLLLAYAGLIVTPLWSGGLLCAAAGLAWFVIGAAFVERAVVGAGRALGELVETGLQLVVNTVSFARVGAFALAHAGLSAAVVGVGEATGSRIGYAIALLLGNLLIIALEGLIVGIQTTRLVLFEFFIRFLRGDGRPFRPLPPPGGGHTIRKQESPP
jgi:V/A-type H+-transporting ATPase subunit I